MKIILPGLLLLVAITSACAVPPEILGGKKADNEEWFKCAVPQDCVLLSGSSCTPPMAINAHFVRDWVENHKDDYVCGPGATGPTVHHATCEANRCEVKMVPIRYR